jgi:small subunit ribosomal protein S2
MADVNLAQLLEAGVHFGHKAYRWNPKMFPYIYTERNNIHILDLVQTAYRLKCAKKFLESEASVGHDVLFVGTKRQASAVILQEIKRATMADPINTIPDDPAIPYFGCNLHYVNYRWLGGMLTNWKTVKRQIDRLADIERLEQLQVTGVSKKQQSMFLKQKEKFGKHLRGLKFMDEPPKVAIIIDQKREMTAIKECRKLGIPIVSIIDTNCDPDLIDFPIPGNDDAVRSIKLILSSLTDSLIEGRKKYADSLKTDS